MTDAAEERNRRNDDHTNGLLKLGFVMAGLLSAACLVASALYMFWFLNATASAVHRTIGAVARAQPAQGASAAPPSSGVPAKPNQSAQFTELFLGQVIPAQQDLARLSLLSCGVFCGMAIAFLGFSLFLIGVKGEMSVEAGKEGANVKIARLAPGAFVILCAAVLIGVCATTRPRYRFSQTQVPVPSTPGSQVVPGTKPDPFAD